MAKALTTKNVWTTKTGEPVTLAHIKEEYWACGMCHKHAGGTWPEGHCATVISADSCEVCCTINVTLIPWVDYNWPKQDRSTQIQAAVGRD